MRGSAKRRTPWMDSGPQLCPEVAEPMPPQASFQASLHECATNRVEQKAPRGHNVSSRSRWASRPRGQHSTFAERTAAWMRKQYAAWAAKQFEAARSVSLVKNPRVEKNLSQPKRLSSGVLSQVWSWVQTRYKLSSTKRLRVGEIASLGEKRFVAIVTVEGREFLIGGGSAGVSMLTPLGNTSEAAQAIQGKIDLQGDSE